MPKEKKDGQALNCFLQREIHQKLEKYCSETGLSKTVAIERMIVKTVKEFEEQKNKD